MKIAIYGAGAIGSYLGVRLHQAGAKVSLIARGSQLAAMKANGITLKMEDGAVNVRPFVTGDAGDAGPQDFVFITLKGQDLPTAATDIARLMGRDTTLVTAMNGIPYWYLHGIDSPWEGRTLQSVDPGGAIARVLPPDRVMVNPDCGLRNLPSEVARAKLAALTEGTESVRKEAGSK